MSDPHEMTEPNDHPVAAGVMSKEWVVKGAVMFLVGVLLIWQGADLYLAANDSLRAIRTNQAQSQFVENALGLPGLSSLLGASQEGTLETYRWIGLGAAVLGGLMALGGLLLAFVHVPKRTDKIPTSKGYTEPR